MPYREMSAIIGFQRATMIGCRRAACGSRWTAAWLTAIALLISGTGAAAIERNGWNVRIGLTPVFLDHQTAFLEDFRHYLEPRLGGSVQFVQRSNYREITELLLTDQIDFAWICGYPFVRNRDRLRLVSVPLYRGRPLYQSYLIASADDVRTKSFLDLENRLFAYSDPDSNSGYLVPQSRLRRLGRDPKTFFLESFFTWSHHKVVEAVAAGVADAGAVDGYVWDTLELVSPELVARTRVVEKSPHFGFPPIVSRIDVDPGMFERFQRVLVGMGGDDAGSRLLRRLNLDGFSVERQSLFDDIAVMAQELEQAEERVKEREMAGD